MEERPPWVTWSFAAVIVLFAWLYTGFVPTEASVLRYAWSREAWQAGEWWRLATSLVAHGGLLHLVANTLSLLALGGALERRLGAWRHALVLAFAGVGGAFAHVATSATPVVGASGAIFGLLGALLVLAPAERVTLLFVRVPVVIAAAFYAAAVALVPAFAVGPVAHAAHLGGLVAGALVVAAYEPRTALRHAPWVAAVFVLAFVVTTWLLRNDVLRVVPLWRDDGPFAAFAFLALPLASAVGIGVSLAMLERDAEAEPA